MTSLEIKFNSLLRRVILLRFRINCIWLNKLSQVTQYKLSSKKMVKINFSKGNGGARKKMLEEKIEVNTDISAAQTPTEFR